MFRTGGSCGYSMHPSTEVLIPMLQLRREASNTGLHTGTAIRRSAAVRRGRRGHVHGTQCRVRTPHLGEWSARKRPHISLALALHCGPRRRLWPAPLAGKGREALRLRIKKRQEGHAAHQHLLQAAQADEERPIDTHLPSRPGGRVQSSSGTAELTPTPKNWWMRRCPICRCTSGAHQHTSLMNGRGNILPT